MISRLVFGSLIQEATTSYLSKIPNKSVIIIGGGNGLDFVPFQSQLEGDYWELSASMLRRAKENLCLSGLRFHLGDFSSHESGKFDWAILPFVLDTMNDREIIRFLNSVKSKLRAGGQILVSDFFQSQSFRQNLVQKLMIGFFNLFTHHPRRDLPAIEQLMNECGFQLLEEKSWEKGWIKAQIYSVRPNASLHWDHIVQKWQAKSNDSIDRSRANPK